MASLLVRKSVAVANIIFFLIIHIFFAQASQTFASQSSPAQQTAQQTPQQASPFVLPITKRDSLLNGLQLIVMERPGTGTVTIRLRINSGAMFDLTGKAGLAALTAEMALRGGNGLSAKNIADMVEQLGMSLVHTVGWDTTEFVISGPKDSVDAMFDLLNRAILNPSFDQKEFDGLKAQRIQQAKNRQVDDGLVAREKAIETVFGTHPFGRLLGGSAESTGQITRADLSYYHKRFYIANNSELMVTGDTSIEQITRFARARMGSWKKGEVVPAAFRGPDRPVATRLQILDRPESDAVRAAIAQMGPSRRSDDYFAAMIMVDVLGQINARLAQGISGASIETELEPGMLPGPFIIKIKAPSNEIAGLIQASLEAMRGLQSGQPGIEQVEAAKSRLVGRMAERLKTDDGVAQVILDIETYGLGRDYLIKFAERVNAVTPADAQRAAQTYLKPQASVITIAGPASKLEEPAKKLGAVTVLR